MDHHCRSPPILFRTGNSLGNTGLVAAAHDHFHHLRTAAIQHLGPDHPATARTHVSRAMLKLGARDRDRAQLVVFAYQSGLVE